MKRGPSSRTRRTARIVLLDPAGRVLLFRYDAEGFDPFWILPGGECDPDEDFAQAARRELLEETGIAVQPRPLGIVRQADYEFLGEPVRSVEHFFHVRAAGTKIETSGHTELEKQVMQEHRWFDRVELGELPEAFYPRDLGSIIEMFCQEWKG